MQRFEKCVYVKSGTDFFNMIEIEVRKMTPEQLNSINFSPNLIEHEEVLLGVNYHYKLGKENLVVSLRRHDVTKDITPNPAIVSHVSECDLKLKEKMSKILFRCLSECNIKFSFLRTTEAPLASLIPDIMRKETSADCALINSGSVRADKIYRAGNYFCYGDVYDIYPMQKQLCCIEVSGKNLLLALENGVCKHPTLEGRFCQVSNINFEFDNELTPGYRVNPNTVKIAGRPLDQEAIYKVATTHYLAAGKDGYTSFEGCKHLIEEENRKDVRDVIIEFFSRCIFYFSTSAFI